MRAIGILLVVLTTAGNSSSQVTTLKDPPTQRAKDTTGKDNPSQTTALVNDINAAFAAMEQNIELAYAKLKKEIRDNIDQLNDKIKELDRQIAALNEQAKKLELTTQRMAQLLDSLKKLNSASREGSVSEKQLLPRKIDSLQIQINLSNQKLKEINKQVDAINAEKQELKLQLKILDSQFAQLEKDKQKILSDLAKQKQKTTREAGKRSHEKNFSNTLAQQLNSISLVFKDSIRAADLRYRRIR